MESPWVLNAPSWKCYTKFTKSPKINFRTISHSPCWTPNCALWDCLNCCLCSFVLNTSFTHKDEDFKAAIQEANDPLNSVPLDFGYHQNRNAMIQKHIRHHFTSFQPPPHFRMSTAVATSSR